MKKTIFITMMLLITFAASASNISLQEIPFDANSLLATLSLYIAAILPLTGWIKTAIKIEDNSAQYLSWVVGISLAFVGWAFDLGFFANYTVWWHILIIGALGSFAANGVFKTSVAQWALSLIKAN